MHNIRHYSVVHIIHCSYSDGMGAKMYYNIRSPRVVDTIAIVYLFFYFIFFSEKKNKADHPTHILSSNRFRLDFPFRCAPHNHVIYALDIIIIGTPYCGIYYNA